MFILAPHELDAWSQGVQSEGQQLGLVRQCGLYIRYCTQPSHDVLHAAASSDAMCLRDIPAAMQSYDIIKVALLQRAAAAVDTRRLVQFLTHNPRYARMVRPGDVTSDTLHELVRANPSIMGYLQLSMHTPELCEMAVMQQPDVIEHCVYQTETAALAAVQVSPELLTHVRSPSREVCVAAGRRCDNVELYQRI